MGSNREVIENPSEVGSASEFDGRAHDRTEDTDDVLVSDDPETEDGAQDDKAALEAEKK